MTRRLPCVLMLIALCATACAGSYDEPPQAPVDWTMQPPPDMSRPPDTTSPPPEREQFLVRELATSDALVFVPNSDPQSNTVAVIDGRDLRVTPLQVGQRPTQIRATQVQQVGAVAYVLCEGDQTLAIIRADLPSPDGRGAGQVSLLRLPREVNALAVAPDGKHAIAYIDPTRPLPPGSSVASLQAMALIRLGDTPAQDAVFQLSVTSQIRAVQFTQDSSQAFIVGREGINRLRFNAVERDAFIAPLPLNLDSDRFDPATLEVVLDPLGAFLLVRSDTSALVAAFRLEQDAISPATLITLPDVPTDVDIIPYSAPEPPRALFTLRASAQLAILPILQALEPDQEDPSSLLTLYDVSAGAGLAQVSPNGAQILAYSSLLELPTLDVLTLAEPPVVQSYPIMNQIASMALTSDGARAILVHRAKEGAPDADASQQERFRHQHALTIVDLETGYRRPLLLPSFAQEIALMNTSQGDILYVMLGQPDASAPQTNGLLRVDLTSLRADFTQLPRPVVQLGAVVDKVFVSQQAGEGRITFFDVITQAQRTISGYELNARID